MDKKKKSTRKSTAPKIKDLDAKQRRLAIIKQKQCDSIAVNIVSKLIDPVEEDVFLLSLKYLNQCHYDDIVEERVIGKLCGYPICTNGIEDMPAKKFHISTKSNKIYDIMERKNYCSNFCYNAGVYIKEQMLTTPLWFRDKEEIPDFHLLPKTESGLPGREIDQGILKLDAEDAQNFTSISKFTQDMVNEIPETVYDKFNIEENTSLASQETEHKEDLKIEESKQPVNEPINIAENNKNESGQKKESSNGILQYFTNIFGPNLADILKENAEYFDNELTAKTETKSLDRTQINIYQNEESIKNVESKSEESNNHKKTGNGEEIKEKLVDETVENKIEENKKKEKIKLIYEEMNKVENNEKKNDCPSKSDTYKIGFNRTIINTKSGDKHKSKGILMKQKNKNTQKKRVSFSRENSVQELKQNETVENNKVEISKKYKTSATTKAEDNKGPRFKNKNVIGVVQERSNIFKIMTVNKEKDEGENKEKSNSFEKEKLVNNHESGELKISQEQNDKETMKEKRLSRLKNSSTYRNANRLSKTDLQSTNSPQSDLKSKLDTCMTEWFTFDTVIFLYGEDRIKETISEKSFKHYFNKKKDMELDEAKQRQYEEICKRLSLMEFADQKFDESITGKKRRPLPRYEDIRQQAEHMDLRVQAFYASSYEMYEEDVDTDTESVQDNDDEDKPNIVQGPPAVLPLVDNKDIMAMRRRIFQTCISGAILNVCEIIKESPNTLLAELKHLINTFEFTATNIVFKTREWQLVTLLLIQILSIRETNLRSALTSNEVSVYLSSLSSQFGLQENYIEELLNKVQIQNLLDDCMRKDCIQ